MDPAPSGTMHLGGASHGAPCFRASDFWCSTNWRLVTDAFGCARWSYDIRPPAPGESAQCQRIACTPGAYVFCRCADGSEGTKLCKADGAFEDCGPCD